MAEAAIENSKGDRSEIWESVAGRVLKDAEEIAKKPAHYRGNNHGR
jgi:hypothetical protein